MQLTKGTDRKGNHFFEYELVILTTVRTVYISKQNPARGGVQKFKKPVYIRKQAKILLAEHLVADPSEHKVQVTGTQNPLLCVLTPHTRPQISTIH